MHMFSKKHYIIDLNLHSPFIAVESTVCIFFIFWPSKICVSTTSIISYLSLPGGAFPPADVTILPHRVMLPSHEAKMSSLPPLHLPAMLCPIASTLKLKLKH
jgi:hypothetical protein